VETQDQPRRVDLLIGNNSCVVLVFVIDIDLSRNSLSRNSLYELRGESIGDLSGRSNFDDLQS
jgi:hypothetical protein